MNTLYVEMKLGTSNNDELLLDEISVLLCSASLKESGCREHISSPLWLSLLLRLLPVSPAHIQRRLMRTMRRIIS